MIKKIIKKAKLYCLIYPSAYLIKGVLRLLILSCRIDVKGLERFVTNAQTGKSILMLWHNRLGILPELLAHYAPQFIYCGVISKSQDGELLSILAKSYIIGRTLRVPHNARHQALGKMINQLKQSNEIIVITPDGPRGPRFQIKQGVIVAAKETSASIIPFTWSASRFWQMSTWDKLIIPKPFSRIVAVWGEPILLEKDSDREQDAIFLGTILKQQDQEACQTLSSDPASWPQ